MVERLAIRSLVAVTLAIAASALIWAPIPMDAEGRPDLPGPAFGQIALYRLETGLFVFYGGLLLITPVFTGLVRGRLPTEISTRGAKFATETDQWTAREEVAMRKLEEGVSELAQKMNDAHIELDRLKDKANRDNS